MKQTFMGRPVHHSRPDVETGSPETGESGVQVASGDFLGRVLRRRQQVEEAVKDTTGEQEKPKADETAYQNEIKATHLKLGYGSITKEDHDKRIQEINKKYGRE